MCEWIIQLLFIKSRRLFLLFVTCCFFGTGFLDAAWGESSSELDALRSRIETLESRQEDILSELKAIQRLLNERSGPSNVAGQAPFEPLDLNLQGARIFGDQAAPVTLVEFVDYQCPHCRRHSLLTKPKLLADYVETGKIRYMIREFPNTAIHPEAFRASEAALCAGDQDKYWEMNNLLFQQQQNLHPLWLVIYAERLGLDMNAFKACFEKGVKSNQVLNELEAGKAAGVNGTPTFFLGLTDSEDLKVFTATEALKGAHRIERFQQSIDLLVRAAENNS